MTAACSGQQSASISLVFTNIKVIQEQLFRANPWSKVGTSNAQWEISLVHDMELMLLLVWLILTKIYSIYSIHSHLTSYCRQNLGRNYNKTFAHLLTCHHHTGQLQKTLQLKHAWPNRQEHPGKKRHPTIKKYGELITEHSQNRLDLWTQHVSHWTLYPAKKNQTNPVAELGKDDSDGWWKLKQQVFNHNRELTSPPYFTCATLPLSNYWFQSFR